jgi:hypothetical protein
MEGPDERDVCLIVSESMPNGAVTCFTSSEARRRCNVIASSRAGVGHSSRVLCVLLLASGDGTFAALDGITAPRSRKHSFPCATIVAAVMAAG